MYTWTHLQLELKEDLLIYWHDMDTILTGNWCKFSWGFFPEKMLLYLHEKSASLGPLTINNNLRPSNGSPLNVTILPNSSDFFSKFIYAHLWIRILWSWCPCVAIMTSASSSTNTLMFLGSMNLNLLHQSSMVPGVPITICSRSFIPRCTENRRKKHTLINTQSNLWCNHRNN